MNNGTLIKTDKIGTLMPLIRKRNAEKNG